MLHGHSVSSFAFVLRAVCAATKRRPDAIEASGPRIDWAPPKASWECHFKKALLGQRRFFARLFLASAPPPDCEKPSPHSKPLGTSASKRSAPSRRRSTQENRLSRSR